MKQCFLHVGTHKTGTSSLQYCITKNERALFLSGILVPKTGRPVQLLDSDFVGHHNIAWELSGDPRFRPETGTLEGLIAEIAAAGAPKVLLSSEDFEHLVAKPEALNRLKCSLAGIGYSTTVIAFVRPQADYIESLYLELLKHGLVLRFQTFLDAILRDGFFRFGQCWCFQFDYKKLMDALCAIFGAPNVILRHYDSEIQDELFDAFLAVVDGSHRLSAATLQKPPRLNRRIDPATAAQLLHRNHSQIGGGVSFTAVPPLQLWNPGDILRVSARFRDRNAELARTYGPFISTVSAAS